MNPQNITPNKINKGFIAGLVYFYSLGLNFPNRREYVFYLWAS